MRTLPDFGRSAVHLGTSVRPQHDARRAGVVEPLRVADVLEAEGEPDAPPDALAARGVAGAARKPERVAGKRLFGRDGKRRGTADDLPRRKRAGDHLPGREEVARLERVQEPKLDRVDRELGCKPVHLGLGREARLHGAEAAHRAARRVVGVDGRRLDQRVVDAIRADRERRRVRRDGGGARRVRAAVEEDLHAHACEPAVAGRAVLAADPRGMAVDVPRERLGPVVDHLHRASGVQREQGAVDLHREVLASAERPAHAREVDPHLLGPQREAGRDLVAVDVQPLGRDVDVDAALAVGDGEARLRAEERLVLDPELVLARDGDVALRVGVAVADHHVADDIGTLVVAVTVAHRRPVRVERLLLERTLHVDDRLERLVLHGDRRERLPCLLGVLGSDDRDRLADVAHPVDRENGLVGELEAVELRAGHVGMREHRVDAGNPQRGREVDPHDPGVGVVAAQRVAPEHPRRGEVARILELAGDLRHRVVPQHALADAADRQAGTRADGAHVRSAASRTASKIFA